MNEFEKQVSNSLSEEEQDKIAGGIINTRITPITQNELYKLYEKQLERRREALKYQEYLRYREYLENEKKQNTAETTPTTEPNTTNP